MSPPRLDLTQYYIKCLKLPKEQLESRISEDIRYNGQKKMDKQKQYYRKQYRKLMTEHTNLIKNRR